MMHACMHAGTEVCNHVRALEEARRLLLGPRRTRVTIKGTRSGGFYTNAREPFLVSILRT